MVGSTTSAQQAGEQMQQAAQTPPPAPAQQPIATENAPRTAMVPNEAQPQYQIPAQTTKRSGLGGIVDELRDALTGGQGGWGRVAAEALTGAAAGASVRGRGTAGQAAFAGVQQGEHMEQMREQQQERQRQQQQQDMQNERQAKLDQFNFVKLQHDIAAGDFELAQRKVEAAEHETQFSQQQQDRQIAMGSVDLGSYKDPADFTRVQEQDPEFWKNAYGMRVVTIPDIGENGERQGIRVFLQKADVGNQLAPKDATLWVFNPPGEGEKPKLEPHTVSVPMTNNELTARNAAMYKQYQDFVKAQADAADKESQQKLRDAQTKTQGTEQTKNRAEANEANARAESLRLGATNPDGTPNQRFEMLAQAVYDGDVLPADLKREAKGAGLDPNALMARATEIGQQRGRPWSSAIIEQEHKFASNTKTQAALDGIDRIIGKPGEQGQGYLNQALTLAQKAHLSSHGAFNSVELAAKRALGDTDAKNLQTAISETRRSIAGLIGNPVLGGSDSDKKLEQADDMLGQSPTLENLQGAANVLKTALETQRQSMVQNNRYLQRRYAGGATPNASAAAQVQPGEPTATGANGQLLVVRNGQWVPAQHP